MHKYSCDNDRRDFVNLVSLLTCAAAAYALTCAVDWLLGGINIILDFLLFVASFGPLSLWVLFTDCFSSISLKLSGICNISGTYKGELKTNYDGFTKDHPITIEIRQKFLEMEIRFSTESSKSCSTTAYLRQNGDRVEVIYTYQNDGAVEEGLNRHIGTCIITVEKGRIEGTYYTHPDRKSYGTIVAKK